MMSSARSGSCCKNGMVRMESTQVWNVTIIGRPSPSPTSRARNWSQPPMAPCLGTRVLSARRKWILLAEPLLRRSAMEGPPSSAHADGSRTPYELLSSFSLAAKANRVEAQGFRLPFRALARLAQDEEPGGSGREARGGGGLGEMTRRKREITGLANEQDFPHLVELALPPGGFRSVFLEIDAFHRERRIPVRRGRSRHEVKQVYIRFCFPDTATADAF